MKKFAAISLLAIALVLAACAPAPSSSETSSHAPNNNIGVYISPASPTLAPGGTQQFTVTITGSPVTVMGSAKSAVSWTLSGGSITATGLYTAPDTPGT